MMRSIRFLFLTLAAVAVCSTALCQQEVKIGFISLKKISEESLRKKEFEGQLKAFLEKKKAERDAMLTAIQDLETAKALSGPEQAKKEEEKIKARKLELLELDRALRAEIERQQAIFEKDILQDIAKAVKEVAAEKGYTWVLLDEVLMHKDESADLTFQTLVKMNDQFLKNRPEAKPTNKESVTSGASSLSETAENGIIDDVLKNGVRTRYTIKEIQPRKASGSGSITMKGEGGQVRFVAQYPKDLALGAGGVVSAPMGTESVWRFAGEVALSGYSFRGLDEKRPLTFILLDEIGLVHLYGRGSVTFPDGHSVAVEEEGATPTGGAGTKE